MEAEPEKTLPRTGLVSQIRQNWSVFEDEALAQQMQQQEISEHLVGNRVRNKILREDIPLSRQEQQIEEQQATADLQQYKQKLDEVAEKDEEIARDLAWKQERRFKFDAQYVAKRDEAFAKNLQRIEREYREKRARDGEYSDYRDRDRGEQSYHDLGGGLQYHEDQYQLQVAVPALVTEEPVYINNNNNTSTTTTTTATSSPRAEPLSHNISSEFSGGRSSRSSRSSSSSQSSLGSNTTSELAGACGGAPVQPSDYLGLCSALSPAELRAAEAAERLLEQERKDREIARRLQDQLSAGDHSDRKLAIEAQDHEFAKVLQAKEKAKAKRAREKARQRKLERQRQEVESHSEDPDAICRAPDDQPRPSTSTSHRDDHERSPRSPALKPPSRKPYVHEGAIDSHVNDTFCTRQITPAHSESEESEPRYANIRKNGEPVNEEPILAIKKSGKHKSQPSVLDTDMPTPPYMPMQPSTSKKSASLERKIKKKKEKEGCKQQ